MTLAPFYQAQVAIETIAILDKSAARTRLPRAQCPSSQQQLRTRRGPHPVCLAGGAPLGGGSPVHGHRAYPQRRQTQPRCHGLRRPQGWAQGAIDPMGARRRLSRALPSHYTPLDLWLCRTNALSRISRAQPGGHQGRHQHHGERGQQQAGKPAVAARSRHAAIVGVPHARRAAARMPRAVGPRAPHRLRALPRPPAEPLLAMPQCNFRTHQQKRPLQSGRSVCSKLL